MSRPRPQRPPALRYLPARRTDVETLADLGYRAYRVASLEKRRDRLAAAVDAGRQAYREEKEKM